MEKIIKLELVNENGETVVYKAPDFIKSRIVRKGLELNSKMEKEGMSPEILDGMIEYVVSAFENEKLTVDAIYDGMDARELMPIISKITGQLMGSDGEVGGK